MAAALAVAAGLCLGALPLTAGTAGATSAAPGPSAAASEKALTATPLDARGRPALPRSYRHRRPARVCRSAIPNPLIKERADGVVVHYALSGRDVVPAADRDRSGVPDYVECTAAAASRGVDLFRRFGLRAPLADHSPAATADPMSTWFPRQATTRRARPCRIVAESSSCGSRAV